jgi:uncharacterized protein
MYEYGDNEKQLVTSRQMHDLLNGDMKTIIRVKDLMKHLRVNFKLDWNGIHGAGHWARVLNNGLMLAKEEKARVDVVTLFAFLHDHKREHDEHDITHGARATEAAKDLRDKYFKIDDEGFELLCHAMTHHSDGHIIADISVQCCWDADRLDLGRVGIMPNPKYLCTSTAKRPEVIDQCYQKSIK